MKAYNQKEEIGTKLKVNDNVVVISGADKGRRGKILKINTKSQRVIVEGINKKNRKMRATQENPKGSVINIEFPIQLSNVQIFCEKCKKGSRIGIQEKDKNKVRICKKCGKTLD